MESPGHKSRHLVTWSRQANLLYDLFRSRELYEIQNIDYGLTSVNNLDVDQSQSFLLSALCNGSINIQEVVDTNYGRLEQATHMKISNVNLHRVQWYPGGEQFFSALDNSTLFLIDPMKMQVVDKYKFHTKTLYSEWNINDHKIISVCGSESQVRLVDIQSGNCAQTIILSAPSQLPTHRPTRCVWSKTDTYCLCIGDNEGYLHIFDTRHARVPILTSNDDTLPQISGLSFTTNSKNLLTAHGLKNKLVEWSIENCQLIQNKEKYKKVEKKEMVDNQSVGKDKSKMHTNARTKAIGKKVRKTLSIPESNFLKCQFYMTDRLLFCPAPVSAKKSKELYIYDQITGTKIKTLKSKQILSKGIHSVTGLLPNSSAIFVGGKKFLKVWTFDENYRIKFEEETRKFHKDDWDSD